VEENVEAFSFVLLDLLVSWFIFPGYGKRRLVSSISFIFIGFRTKQNVFH
jgi:hypothetical protein